MRKFTLLVAAFLALLPLTFSHAQEAPKPEAPKTKPEAKLPTRAEKGPGSTEYAHKSVATQETGEGAKRYWLYTPAEPAPKDAPVVCFVHGFGAFQPEPYLGWIQHICMRGNIVVYPQYQASQLEPPANYAPNCAEAVLAAIAWLKEDAKRVQPREKDFAVVGHSAGGVTTANIAADWETLKLPRPKAAMPVQPGRAFSYNSEAQKNGLIPLSEFNKIPEDCLLVSVYGDSDSTVGHYCARKVFADATTVKAANKNLVRFKSCLYCETPSIANHRSPAALEEVHDCLDWFGYWKLFDGLTDAAFHNKNRNYALGNTPEQRFMGKCSDGHPHDELDVTLGDAKVDPDEAYIPLFNDDGSKFGQGRPGGRAPRDNRQPPRERAPEPPKPAPPKEDPAKEEEF